MKPNYEIIWAVIGAIGATAKYFNDVVTNKRKFILREFVLLIVSGGFAAWLIAKMAYVFLSVSIDMALVISAISGVLGFGSTVAILDKFFSKFFSK